MQSIKSKGSWLEILLLENGKRYCFVRRQISQNVWESKETSGIILDNNWSGVVEGCPRRLCQRLDVWWMVLDEGGFWFAMR